MVMLTCCFRQSKDPLETLNDVIENQMKDRADCEEEAARHEKDAKSHKLAGKNKAALASMKSLKRCQLNIENIDKCINKVQEQKMALQAAGVHRKTLGALKHGAAALKKIQKTTNIDSADKLMDEIVNHVENFSQVKDSIGTPVNNDYDDDVLQAQLDEMIAADAQRDAQTLDAERVVRELDNLSCLTKNKPRVEESERCRDEFEKVAIAA